MNKKRMDGGVEKMRADFIIDRISSVLTMKTMDNFSIDEMKDASIAVKDGIVCCIAPTGDFDERVTRDGAIVIDAKGKTVTPGFVDSHTHLVFGGSRVDEFSFNLRKDGKDMIKHFGLKTGIYSSIDMTRKASEEELYLSALKRLSDMMKFGTTTVEIKSGYGIDKETELRQLRLIKRLKQELPITIRSTYLGGHIWPENESKESYLKFMIEEMLPLIADEGLADACDIWIEDSYYSVEDARKLLTRAKELGMQIKAHTNELSDIGAARLAAELGFASVDHMNYVKDEELKLLKEAGVVVTALPGTDLSIRHPYPVDGRRMLDMGITMALATNLNPSNYSARLRSILYLACMRHGFSIEEALKAATRGGAKALGLEKTHGLIEVGCPADLLLWNTDDYRNLVYMHDSQLLDRTYAKGRLIDIKCGRRG